MFCICRVALRCLGVVFGRSGDLVVDSCEARPQGQRVAFCEVFGFSPVSLLNRPIYFFYINEKANLLPLFINRIQVSFEPIVDSHISSSSMHMQQNPHHA
jgi:hypothetical protein